MYKRQGAICLILGTFIEIVPVFYLTVPIFAAITLSFNQSLLHLYVVFVAFAGIGMITPPVCVGIYTAAGVINAGKAAMKELTLSLKEAFSSVLICLHLNKTRRTIKTRRTKPGITPAAKVLETGTLVKALNSMAALDGGINASKSAAEAARTTTKGVG